MEFLNLAILGYFLDAKQPLQTSLVSDEAKSKMKRLLLEKEAPNNVLTFWTTTVIEGRIRSIRSLFFVEKFLLCYFRNPKVPTKNLRSKQHRWDVIDEVLFSYLSPQQNIPFVVSYFIFLKFIYEFPIRKTNNVNFSASSRAPCIFLGVTRSKKDVVRGPTTGPLGFKNSNVEDEIVS